MMYRQVMGRVFHAEISSDGVVYLETEFIIGGEYHGIHSWEHVLHLCQYSGMATVLCV